MPKPVRTLQELHDSYVRSLTDYLAMVKREGISNTIEEPLFRAITAERRAYDQAFMAASDEDVKALRFTP